MQRLSARLRSRRMQKSVGSYAFYNCRNLERIELTDSVSEFGGGALMNCMSLREVILHAAPFAPTYLPRLLGEYAGELDVQFDEHARLLFPEYVEELEDLSPAHIFQRRIHGEATATVSALTAVC